MPRIVYCLKARRLLAQKKISDCISLCQGALEDKIYDIKVLSYHLMALLALPGYRAAIEVLSRFSDYLDEHHSAVAYLRLGQLYDLVHDRSNAVERYQKALSLPDSEGIISEEVRDYVGHPFTVERFHWWDWVYDAHSSALVNRDDRVREPLHFLKLIYSVEP